MDFPGVPYTVQGGAINVIREALQNSQMPAVAVELPTGCGKTLALLHAVVGFQQSVARQAMGKRDLRAFVNARTNPQYHLRARKQAKPKKKPAKKGSKKNGEQQQQQPQGPNLSSSDDDEEDPWRPPKEFFKQFRKEPNKRLRVERGQDEVSNLRDTFAPPAMSVFYLTRTHAQVTQCVDELRKFPAANDGTLRVNVLASRERYCINPVVMKNRSGGALPNEGNNLGEVCDKMVALAQCSMVHNFNDLAASAMTRSINGLDTRSWQIEDLCKEGSIMNACPYYAARELVFYADVNFGTYNYLLDPIIRNECKYEKAVKNNSIVVFDEAHNVQNVCQDVLSMEVNVEAVRSMVAKEVLPHTSHADPSAFATLLSYPRGFSLADGLTLVDVMDFLYKFLVAIVRITEANAPQPPAAERFDENATSVQTPGEEFVTALQFTPRDWTLFRHTYGIIQSLGVTFNPFDFSIYNLGLLKRLLLIVRFLGENPKSFVTWVDLTTRNHMRDGQPLPPQVVLRLRCLDSSLAFHHLLASTYRIVLASGTLSPFDQLSANLRVPLDVNGPRGALTAFQGGHVVDTKTQCFVGVVNRIKVGSSDEPLHCVRARLMNKNFVVALAENIAKTIMATPKAHAGGSLVFTPNYSVNQQLAGQLRAILSRQSVATQVFEEGGQGHRAAPASGSEGFEHDLNRYRSRCQSGRPSVFVAVHRGKLSEGVNFIDAMARLVICVGVPYAPMLSPEVIAQRNYSGSRWYTVDAMMAVNQAMGRCLRHVKDFGAIVLMDQRYASEETLRSLLSPWAAGIMRTFETCDSLCSEMGAFFDMHQPVRVVVEAASENEPTFGVQRRRLEGVGTAGMRAIGLSAVPNPNNYRTEANKSAKSLLLESIPAEDGADDVLGLTKSSSSSFQRGGVYGNILALKKKTTSMRERSPTPPPTPMVAEQRPSTPPVEPSVTIRQVNPFAARGNGGAAPRRAPVPMAQTNTHTPEVSSSAMQSPVTLPGVDEPLQEVGLPGDDDSQTASPLTMDVVIPVARKMLYESGAFDSIRCEDTAHRMVREAAAQLLE